MESNEYPRLVQEYERARKRKSNINDTKRARSKIETQNFLLWFKIRMLTSWFTDTNKRNRQRIPPVFIVAKKSIAGLKKIRM